MNQKTGCYIPIPIVCDDCNKAPHIGENGNWWIGDEDTGVKAQGSKEEVYSTEATRIGSWIDGKPIYRRVFQYGGTIPAFNPAAGMDVVVTVVPESSMGNIGQVLKLYGYATSAVNLVLNPIPHLRIVAVYKPSEGIRIVSRFEGQLKSPVIVAEYTV